SVVEGYRGLSINYLGETKAIPVIADTNGLEYRITMLMKQMTGERVKIGLVGGHEGPSLEGELAVLRRVMPTYDLVEVNLEAALPEDIETLLVIAPTAPFSEAELRKLDAFVMGGGSLGVFGGGIKLEEAQTLSASPVDSGLNRLLERWGVKINSDVLGDARCQVIGVRSAMGMVPRPYPPLAIVQFTDEQAEHPATYRLTEARMPFSSTLTLTDAPEGVERSVLATSSEQSWSITGSPIDLNQNQRWTLSGPVGPFPLVVALEGKLPSAFAGNQSSEAGAAMGPAESTEDVRVLVFGSGAAPIIQLPQGQEVADEELAAALALPLNAVDWLANDDDLIAIRAKTVDEPSLDIPQAVLEAQDEETQAIENR
ncbi:MAG: GldG family protein, partial [Polyangiaceae bacterium]|nr:GldG family protein [Polyangiaceae bacterium]